MTTLIIRGLQDEGPGDIVGAFVNEATIDPDAIGTIDLNGGEATVEIEDRVAGRAMEVMDGGRIGRSTVSVDELDDERRVIRSYVQTYRQLVEHEREEEMRRHEQEIRQLSGREREAKGRALLRLRGRDEGEGLGGHLVKFMRQQKGEPLPDTEIRVGDLVMLSKKDPLRDDNPTGTVTQVTNYSITAAFDGRPPGFIFGDGLRADLYVNDITYQRMKDALAQLPDAEDALADLRDIIVGLEPPAEAEAEPIDTWHNAALNASQRDAVRAAVHTPDLHLIHGPPGTGKTTTAIEAIQQCVERGESVLATADSNTAVDNMLEFLIDQGVNAVRVGHPARVTPALQQQTLDARIEKSSTYQRSQRLRDEAFNILDQQDELTHPSGRWRRGMSDERIQELAEKGRSSRGVPAEKIEEMAAWLDLRERADQLFERADTLEQQAIDELLTDVEVVCTTNSTAGSDLLAGRTFDTLVIDEATQATEPSCLIPIVHAKRVIMAGDHRQLPPTILSARAANEGLRRTLFERLADRHYDELVSLLQVQYRMHKTIMGFSSTAFYDDALAADGSVRTHTLADFDITLEDLPEEHWDVLDPDAPLVFVNTVMADAPEEQRPGSTSRENPREAQLVVQYAQALLDAGVDPSDLAVISPYDDQVDRINGMLDLEALEVDTVDGFQGREKEVVLISLVRSNENGEVGFLDESRRFNVAVTRARRKAVVVGDIATIGRADVFAAFQDYVQQRGREIML